MAHIGICWCTWFAGSWFSRHWRLPHAYRPPALFAAKMRDGGHTVEIFGCDEHLELSRLDGNKDRLQDAVDILYVMTHGNFDGQNQGYQAELNAAKWLPAIAGIGTATNSRLSVAVFDTCHLIDSKQTNWQSKWTQSLGHSLRLILGFEGSVAIDRGSALRGNAFAQELTIGNKTFADAWLLAADSTIPYPPEYKQAVAIGVGDDASDAQAILASASLANMPPPRKGGTPVLALKR